MRFLKKINEDFSTSHKQLADDIQDICLELHDTDMEFNVLSNSKYFPVNYSLKGERQGTVMTVFQ